MTGLKIRLRLDFPGYGKNGRSLFGGKNLEQNAEENRQHKVSLLRNVPIQGIRIEDIEMSQEVYCVVDDLSGKTSAYAPVIITFFADGIEDAIKFCMKEEFRTVEVLEPDTVEFTRYELERLLFRISEESAEYKDFLVRKVNNWK